MPEGQVLWAGLFIYVTAGRQHPLCNGGRVAQVMGFHCHTAAAVAGKLHLRQFVFAHMFGFGIRGTAKAAFFFIAAGITQVTGCLCHSTAIFT